jgi:hypothetical protein
LKEMEKSENGFAEPQNAQDTKLMAPVIFMNP